MASLFYFIPKREVRTLVHSHFKAPWAFFWKSHGLTSVGPHYQEMWEWPAKQKGFGLSPKFRKNNHVKLRGYTGCQLSGYMDEKRGKFVEVPDMQPKLIVPDLKNFDLKPYVSFRCAETTVVEKPMDAKKLFDACYAKEIKRAYKNGKYKDVKTVLTNDRKKIIEQYSIPTIAPD